MGLVEASSVPRRLERTPRPKASRAKGRKGQAQVPESGVGTSSLAADYPALPGDGTETATTSPFSGPIGGGA
jgi:hypothetical protein